MKKEILSSMGIHSDELIGVLVEINKDGCADNLVSLEKEIESLKAQIDDTNKYRQELGRREKRIKKLIKIIESKCYNKPEERILQKSIILVLKYQVRRLQYKILKTKPDDMLEHKNILKEERTSLVEMSELTHDIMEALR